MDDDLKDCARCHTTMRIDVGDDPTEFCCGCAHDEIAALKAEVERLRLDHERAIETLTVSGVALDIHSTMSMTTHVESVVSQVRDILGENQALRLDLAAHRRALAAGLAALREYEEHHGVEKLIADVTAGQDAEIARLRGWAELVLSWSRNPDRTTLDHDAVEQACMQALFPGKASGG